MSTKRRPLPNKLEHLKMQAAMPGTLNGDSALAELQQMSSPTAPAPVSAGDAPTAPAPAPASVVRVPVEQSAPPAVEPTPAGAPPDIEQSTAAVDEQPTAPTPAPPAESTVPAGEELEQASGVGAEGPEASKASAPVTRPRKESVKAPDKPTVSPGLDGSGGAVRISAAHANELLGARLHYQTEHNLKASNQGIVADALDHYLAYLRKKGVLPPKP
jgi:hypothetical protein